MTILRPIDERQLWLDLWNDETAWMPTPANENQGPKLDIDRLLAVIEKLSPEQVVRAWNLAIMLAERDEK